MPYVRPNPLVITATGDTRMSGFVKLDANESYIVDGLNTEAGRIDDLESTVEALTGTTQYQVAAGTAEDTLLSPLSAAQLRGHGECRLVKSGSDLKLERVGLGRMLVNGLMVQVPVAGVTLSTSGLSEDTLFYIYLAKTDVDSNSDGIYDSYTLSLLASATAPTQSATSGIMVMTGDATKTLVGMAKTVTGPAWADTQAKRFVLSYFNRKPLSIYVATTAERTTTETALTEVSAGDERAYFLKWSDVDAFIGGFFTLTVNAASTGGVAIGRNTSGAWAGSTATATVYTSGWKFPITIPVQAVPGAVTGENYATVMLQAQSGYTSTLPNGTAILMGHTWG